MQRLGRGITMKWDGKEIIITLTLLLFNHSRRENYDGPTIESFSSENCKQRGKKQTHSQGLVVLGNVANLHDATCRRLQVDLLTRTYIGSDSCRQNCAQRRICSRIGS